MKTGESEKEQLRNMTLGLFNLNAVCMSGSAWLYYISSDDSDCFIWMESTVEKEVNLKRYVNVSTLLTSGGINGLNWYSSQKFDWELDEGLPLSQPCLLILLKELLCQSFCRKSKEFFYK